MSFITLVSYSVYPISAILLIINIQVEITADKDKLANGQRESSVMDNSLIANVSIINFVRELPQILNNQRIHQI